MDYRKPVPRWTTGCRRAQELADTHIRKHGGHNADVFWAGAEKLCDHLQREGWSRLECEIMWSHARAFVGCATATESGCRSSFAPVRDRREHGTRRHRYGPNADDNRSYLLRLRASRMARPFHAGDV